MDGIGGFRLPDVEHHPAGAALTGTAEHGGQPGLELQFLFRIETGLKLIKTHHDRAVEICRPDQVEEVIGLPWSFRNTPALGH